MTTRNRALKAIQDLVHAKERAVIEAALIQVVGQQTNDLLEGTVLETTTLALLDARALLAKANGTAP